VDSFHPTQGLKHKLLAYKAYLEIRPQIAKQMVLVQYVTPPFSVGGCRVTGQGDYFLENVKMLKELREQIYALIDEIKAEFGECIILQEENPELEKRLALWS